MSALHSLGYSALMPPTLFIFVIAAGLALITTRRKLGLIVAATATGALYLASLPATNAVLLGLVAQGVGPTLPDSPAPEAIIVLGSDVLRGEHRDTVGPYTLERLIEGARLHRRTGLPVLVSGGPPRHADSSLAAMMADILETDLATPVRWREESSSTTFENAANSAAILRGAGIVGCYVVVQPWDGARVRWSFARVGLAAVIAPTAEPLTLPWRWSNFFPNAGALYQNFYAMHEILGLAYYRAFL